MAMTCLSIPYHQTLTAMRRHTRPECAICWKVRLWTRLQEKIRCCGEFIWRVYSIYTRISTGVVTHFLQHWTNVLGIRQDTILTIQVTPLFDYFYWLQALYLDGTVFIPQELPHIQDLIIEKQLRIYALPEELEILRSDDVNITSK